MSSIVLFKAMSIFNIEFNVFVNISGPEKNLNFIKFSYKEGRKVAHMGCNILLSLRKKLFFMSGASWHVMFISWVLSICSILNVLVSRWNILVICYNCQLCICTHWFIQWESSNYMLGELWKEFSCSLKFDASLIV